MIKINLLPQDMAGGRASGSAGSGASSDAAGGALVALVLVVLFGINIAGGLYLFYEFSRAKSAFEAADAEHRDVDKKLKETEVQFREAKSTVERMEQLISVAESLDGPDRLLWARKLNMLPSLVPEGIHINQLGVTRKVTLVETPESIKARNEWEKTKKGTPPEPKRNPVIQQTLTMDLVAYVDGGNANQRLEQILLFSENLKKKKVKLPFDKEETQFFDGFDPLILPSPLTEATLSGREISRTRFTLNSKKVTIK